jgi:hypothetical protein
LPLFGCKQNAPMKHAAMSKILIDMQLADAYTNIMADSISKTNPLMRNKDSVNYYYTQIFKHHNISETAFKKAFNWYASNPKEMDSVISLMQNTTTLWNKEEK